MAHNDVVSWVQAELASVADPDKAIPMAAYMKTDQPFYGVQKAGRTPIVRGLVRTFPPTDQESYESTVRAVWHLPHREEQYVAIGYARAFPEYVHVTSMSLYRDLIVEGAWWDLVDEAASHLVGQVLLVERSAATPTVRSWIEEPDLWLRRTSIIAQLRHNDRTDTDLLSDACVPNLDDPDFFIRKAIGWALRQYARTDPGWVRRFVGDHEERMSPLSVREATKHL